MALLATRPARFILADTTSNATSNNNSSNNSNNNSSRSRSAAAKMTEQEHQDESHERAAVAANPDLHHLRQLSQLGCLHTGASAGVANLLGRVPSPVATTPSHAAAALVAQREAASRLSPTSTSRKKRARHEIECPPGPASTDDDFSEPPESPRAAIEGPDGSPVPCPRAKSSSSKYRGVCWLKSRRAWRARIEVHGKREHLGYFDSEERAALAYDKRARELNGPSARLNFPNCVDNSCESAPGTAPASSLVASLATSLGLGSPASNPGSCASSTISNGSAGLAAGNATSNLLASLSAFNGSSHIASNDSASSSNNNNNNNSGSMDPSGISKTLLNAYTKQLYESLMLAEARKYVFHLEPLGTYAATIELEGKTRVYVFESEAAALAAVVASMQQQQQQHHHLTPSPTPFPVKTEPAAALPQQHQPQQHQQQHQPFNSALVLLQMLRSSSDARAQQQQQQH